MNFGQIGRGAGAVLGVVAVAGVMVIGSQFLRHAQLTAADVIASPSPTSVAQTCISADKCVTSATCVPGEGVVCPSDPVVLAPATYPPTSPPVDQPPNTRAPIGSIQISAVWFVVPSSSTEAGRLGLTIAILSGSDWATGANITGQCTGPGLSQSVSGATAPRANWPSNTSPSIPAGISALFWEILPIAPAADSQGGKYVCHGTATYNGVTASF
jgi:hypothetical protein